MANFVVYNSHVNLDDVTNDVTVINERLKQSVGRASREWLIGRQTAEEGGV